jgi:UDP-N-acetylglucosamine 2-epimerase (non-hydrolysing)
MPEEVNRVMTDQLADLLFTPSADGNANLAREGVAREKVFLVGNVMIDTLIRMLPKTADYSLPELPRQYALVTLHRPANVDDTNWLKGMLETLTAVSRELTVIFPVHPRTRQRISELRFSQHKALRLLDPLPYLEFLALQRQASVVITDSGGIQEETTFLGVPCLTVRDNTERPITVEIGTNEIVGRDLGRIGAAIDQVLAGERKPFAVPPLWDGHAGERIAEVILGNRNVRVSDSEASELECVVGSKTD